MGESSGMGLKSKGRERKVRELSTEKNMHSIEGQKQIYNSLRHVISDMKRYQFQIMAQMARVCE